MPDHITYDWPTKSRKKKGSVNRFAYFFDGQTHKLDRTRYPYKDEQQFRNAVASCAKRMGYVATVHKLEDPWFEVTARPVVQ